jgi:hypothetical protein
MLDTAKRRAKMIVLLENALSIANEIDDPIPDSRHRRPKIPMLAISDAMGSGADMRKMRQNDLPDPLLLWTVQGFRIAT